MKLAILFLLLITSPIAISQIFDCNHSTRFAEYLSQDGRLKQAARCLLEMPDSCRNDSLKMRIVSLYFQAEEYPLAISSSRLYYPGFPEREKKGFMITTRIKSALYSGSSLNSGDWEDAKAILPQDSFAFFTQCYALLRPMKPGEKNQPEPGLQVLAPWVEKRRQTKLKNPLKAALLSAMVPGAGKAYCGLKRDALFSFLMVGMNTFQAWRGFSKKGSESVYGWVSAGFACSFYAGTIYGSARSAKKYNAGKTNEFRKQFVKSIFIN